MGQQPLPDGTREWVARLLATLEEPPPPKPATKRGPPARAELRLAVYSAANPGHEAAALVNLAVPRSREDAPWAMRALRISDLDRFHLDGAAFRGPTPLQVTGDPPTADSVSLDGGSFTASGGRSTRA
ncbi:hypothetical protein [Actinomadura sp. 21ATH]|uniref:hypothetical protein n=1 Tax=Actinomadura sp. 21ATH TaxID=1735444 RepID=UPI0035BF972A